MSDSTTPFLTQASLLDQFIHLENPQEDMSGAAFVLKLLGQRQDLRSYFFNARPSSGWAPLLWESGFLSTPPKFEQDKEGRTWIPHWDVQWYLESIAPSVPEYVVRHVESLREHPIYLARAIPLLAKIPVEFTVASALKLIDLLENYTTGTAIAEALLEVAEYLADNGKHEAEIILQALLAPFPNPRHDPTQTHYFSTEAVSLFDIHDYSLERIAKLCKTLTQQDTDSMLKSLEAMLLRAIEIESESTGYDVGVANWWRSTIESSDQNSLHDYKDHLLDLIRDCSEQVVSSGAEQAKKLISYYLSSDKPILRRLSLHLIRLQSSSQLDLVSNELILAKNYSDLSIHHEFFLLLEAAFPLLNDSLKHRAELLILSGPPAEETEEYVRRRIEHFGNNESGFTIEKASDDYRDHWILTRLWMIRQHLSSLGKKDLERLVAAKGEPEHPAYLSWTSGAGFVSQESPLSTQQLDELTPPELVDFLQSWQPSELDQRSLHRSISWEGLGITLGSAILPRLADYADWMLDICRINPVLTLRFLFQIEARAKENKISAEDWGVLLATFNKFIGRDAATSDIKYSSSTEWREVRKWIASLLGILVTSEEAIPIPALDNARDLLLLLLNDPDPTKADDQPPVGWLGHNDPITVAINHVRPVALNYLIQYAVNTASKSRKDTDEIQPAQSTPEIRAALSHMLKDQSRSVRSVYGRNLTNLFWLDQSWVLTHLSEIFPGGDTDDEHWMFISAWDAYICYNRHLNLDLFERLLPYYLRAMNYLQHGIVTKNHLQSVNCLISHLLLDYIRLYPQRESLLANFLIDQKDEHCAQVAFMAWRLCVEKRKAGKPESEWWQPIRAIWKTRMDHASSLNFPANLDKEMGTWFHMIECAPDSESLESLWSLLQGLLPYLNSTRGISLTWTVLEKFLSERVNDDPQLTVEMLSKMYENTSRLHWSAGRDGHIRRILEVAVSHRKSRRQALALIDLIARKGDLSYRDIYDRFA